MQKRCVALAGASASVPKRCGTDRPLAATVQKRCETLAGVPASVLKCFGTDRPLAATVPQRFYTVAAAAAAPAQRKTPMPALAAREDEAI